MTITQHTETQNWHTTGHGVFKITTSNGPKQVGANEHVLSLHNANTISSSSSLSAYI